MTQDPSSTPFSLEEFISNRLSSNEESQNLIKEILLTYRKGQLFYESEKDFGAQNEQKPSFIRQKDHRYYVQKYDLFETVLVNELNRLKNLQPSSIYQKSVFEQLIAKEALLTDEQKLVMHEFFNKAFGVLCGGPGTGKTFTASMFIKFLTNSIDLEKKKRFKIILSAPTGKAALHLQSYLAARGNLPSFVEYEAMTLHRMLKVRAGFCQVFAKKRIDADLVIIDEASMIDISMMVQLLESIGSDTKIIIMGDPNQLPPVEMSGVFADLAKLFGCFLTKCMRTQEPTLVGSAKAILAGDLSALKNFVEISDRFDANLIDFLFSKSQFQIAADPINVKSFFANLSSFKILNAMRQGPYGLDSLNKQILQKIDQLCPKNHFWAVPILVTQNLAHLNLFNGTFGILTGQKKNKIDITTAEAYFLETNLVPHVNPPTFELSFILSIHKSQGSEFDEVLALFPEGSENFGKEALYTAATRARKKWSIIANPVVLEQMMQKKQTNISALVNYF